jgi:hypothetical protein
LFCSISRCSRRFLCHLFDLLLRIQHLFDRQGLQR